MFHWTDTKIRVHVFYCVLTLAVAHLMRHELLTTLAGIEETVLLDPTGNKGRPRAQGILTDTSPTQKRLFELFRLDTYAPPPLTWAIPPANPRTTPDDLHVHHSRSN